MSEKSPSRTSAGYVPDTEFPGVLGVCNAVRDRRDRPYFIVYGTGFLPHLHLPPKEKHQLDHQNNHHQQLQHKGAPLLELVHHELV